MFALIKKEISSFLSSLIGYVVIVVFLLINGLFLWVFPSEFNILDYGYASLTALFLLSPYVFLLLIPAITMRSFADEKKSGTIEMLFTKPLTDMQIIFAKFSAGVVLVLFSLLPSLIYVISINQLSFPPNNVDLAGTWGSYIGLFFLGSAFVSIGLFASSLTDNQIVSFIIGIFFSFFAYMGFEFIYTLEWFGAVDLFIKNLGINEHYISLSRGVIDTRDLLYFISLIAFFLLLTKISIQSRKW